MKIRRVFGPRLGAISENWLYLNVWTPKEESPARRSRFIRTLQFGNTITL
jgi:hypothetical protein